ncbi:unnamed protein product, partial [Musa hybrid cultivar]
YPGLFLGSTSTNPRVSVTLDPRRSSFSLRRTAEIPADHRPSRGGGEEEGEVEKSIGRAREKSAEMPPYDCLLLVKPQVRKEALFLWTWWPAWGCESTSGTP